MERINYNSFKFLEFIDKLNPQNSGLLFSAFLHLIILLFAVGLPNFFGPKDVFVPNIIPIEILNVSEKTNVEKSKTENQENKKTNFKQKKFNSSDNTEVQKKFEVTEKIKSIDENRKNNIIISENNNIQIQQKKEIKIEQKEIAEIKTKVETLKTNTIKPKLKPKPKKIETAKNNSDLLAEPIIKNENKISNNKISTKPRPKPEEDFSIASMLKDLRNDKSNNVVEDDINEEQSNQLGEKEQNDNMILSISEIDLLRQQLSSCWNAPAGAVINIGDKVTISAKVRKNMQVLENSVRILDTNISKSNPFYGPITDSAMRTLLNPECMPLKLPKDKYKLWKNLTITFDYSIMKGY